MYALILFDLDETLYPRSAKLMDVITERINQYIAHRFNVPIEQAMELRRRFRSVYGTALRGMMEEGYPVNVDEYFAYVHDIELDGVLAADPQLREMLLSIPLRRAVLTNSNIEHALRILRHMGIEDCFERVIDIRALSFRNKPDPLSYQIALEMLRVKPNEVIFVEDTPVNTRAARAIGMTTILIECPPSDAADYFLESVLDVGPLVAHLLNAKSKSSAGIHPQSCPRSG
ncbi:MAG: pyrimidine 5'-nucleotidase [Chloroflexi bacterium]|jgi:putative hydrolase of the HAD superfamily|uniref:Pyrimidine 5'-nucleotidase n=2 Tax=Candidatus Thermofonsia Clade 3 TaxID=2364209 RepID=A0A2M8QAD7_9CHLR|nr:MAG: pyrimidine 5'-nucleotidase [Candidatus Thermofonsia Clade 3 bacterium]RMG63372.1 MAG: pyrimidine 5'-nucleotidase [Chloroflexota bacterium]